MIRIFLLAGCVEDVETAFCGMALRSSVQRLVRTRRCTHPIRANETGAAGKSEGEGDEGRMGPRCKQANDIIAQPGRARFEKDAQERGECACRRLLCVREDPSLRWLGFGERCVLDERCVAFGGIADEVFRRIGIIGCGLSGEWRVESGGAEKRVQDFGRKRVSRGHPWATHLAATRRC